MAPEKLDDETKTEGINSGSIQPVRVTDERVLISSWMFLLLRAISYCCYSYRFSVMQSLLSVCMCVQGNYKSFGTQIKFGGLIDYRPLTCQILSTPSIHGEMVNMFACKLFGIGVTIFGLITPLEEGRILEDRSPPTHQGLYWGGGVVLSASAVFRVLL